MTGSLEEAGSHEEILADFVQTWTSLTAITPALSLIDESRPSGMAHLKTGRH